MITAERAAPLVSVVIPSFNCERYIAETIHSVVQQTFQDWELIVVDDGSSDRTTEIASGIDARVRVLQQKNGGVCAARNRGLAASRGRFVNFLDHDDYWHPEKLQRQLDQFERDPQCGMVFTAHRLWFAGADGFPPPEQMFDGQPHGDLDPQLSGWIYHEFLLDSCALTSSALIRREALDQCGAFDLGLEFSEDWDLFLRLSRRWPFARLSWPFTLYRQHAQQGNRVARPRNYSVELLLRAERTWGLRSPDGRAVDREVFQHRLAHFQMEHGRHHLKQGSRSLGVRTLLQAWQRRPKKVRYLAMAAAGAVGWRPKL